MHIPAESSNAEESSCPIWAAYHALQDHIGAGQSPSREWKSRTLLDEEEAEGDYYQEYDFQQDRQYACLSLSLEDGLDPLKDLKHLRRL